MKYLEVWLDTKMTFAKHVNWFRIRIKKMTTALVKLMPNIRVPRSFKRSVVHSQLLKGASAWHIAGQNKKLVGKLTSVQKEMTVRICSVYKTLHASSQQCRYRTVDYRRLAMEGEDIELG